MAMAGRKSPNNEDVDLSILSEQRWISRRKSQINKIIFSSRTNANKNETIGPSNSVQEANEDIGMEESVEKGFLPLSQYHHRKKKRQSRKRCWECNSRKHFKKQCPWIRCFYCHKLGHVKNKCYRKKLDWIFNQIYEDYLHRKDRQKKTENKNLEKEKQIQEQIRIFKLRAEQLKFQLEKKDGKGQVMVAKYQGKTIGEYIGPGLPSPAMEKLKANKFNWKLINKLAERAIPYNVAILYEGLSFWCPCGANDLTKKDFINHVKGHHNGVIRKGSQLNRPPWLDWIKYLNDEVEERFCYTDYELNNSLLVNYLT